MSAPDPVRRLREIAVASTNHAILADGPVSPDADLLDLCAEALYLLKQARTARTSSWAILNGSCHSPELRDDRARFWVESEALQKRARPVLWRIQKKPAQTPAGIYAKALVVQSLTTGGLAKSLASDLIACRELRESLWPAGTEGVEP